MPISVRNYSAKLILTYSKFFYPPGKFARFPNAASRTVSSTRFCRVSDRLALVIQYIMILREPGEKP